MGVFTTTAADLQTGPYLGDLLPEQLKSARALVRCDLDNTVVAAVIGSVIITRTERHVRSAENESILAACYDCPTRSKVGIRRGELRPRDLRSVSTQAIWERVDQRQRKILLRDVLG